MTRAGSETIDEIMERVSGMHSIWVPRGSEIVNVRPAPGVIEYRGPAPTFRLPSVVAHTCAYCKTVCSGLVSNCRSCGAPA